MMNCIPQLNVPTIVTGYDGNTLVMKECWEKWTGVIIGVMSPGRSKLIYIWSRSDPNLCVGSVISWRNP
jgi:hypothetical protein